MAPIPAAPLPPELATYLAAPRLAVVATLRSDGAPVTVASWYGLEGDRLLLSMDETRVRLAHLRRDPHVALTVLDDEWSRHLSLLGTVETLREDRGLADIDAITRRSTGEPWPDRGDRRLTAVVRVGRWHTWGGPGEMSGDG